ncbi:Methyltransferase domain-containing protein [Halobiforma haloterrestris]|uniref:Methyltransferase domain-containing protein n=1 Tax=Natronobacterium haloterrestre TaxID=148448 RepID=A0A1I1LD87_NATHA|nr:class I SAM-dependent methyltransferase [Halobiforma haloterrestris]SFC70482.1 Methyltransferase domain-containing protein [Halobiforma haloterrestris]
MTGIPDPETYYDEHDEKEWERLESSLHGRLEWESTVEILRTHLPETGHVLDAGGGAGRYTIWLAERGYEVTLVEPSAGQRAIAREKVAEHGLEESVTILEGDIRDLPLDSGRFDATLCLGGPLSHVLEADGRARSVRELERVTAAGRPVFVSVMGLLNWLTLLLVTPRHLDLLPELAESGDYDVDLLGDREPLFTETHFFRADELESLLADADLSVESVVGLEGLASVYSAGPLREEAARRSDAEFDRIRRLVDHQRNDRTVADMSAHMLAVCHVQK